MQILYSSVKNTFTLFLVSACLILLTSCQPSTVPMEGMAQTLPRKPEISSDMMANYMRNKLEKAQIKVISLGQDYLVSIPARILFPTQSPQLTWDAYPILNDVACYLQQFRMITIHITAYSSQYLSDKRERALTLARARNVANYLWSQGVDSRFIFTEGLGSDKPIISGGKQNDRSFNARIEITFRHIVA